MTEPTSQKGKVLRSVLWIACLLLIGGGLGGVLLVLRVEPPRRALIMLPPLVASTEVRAEDVVEWFAGYGTARSMRTAHVAAEVAGTVVGDVDEIRVGAAVRKGQVLVRLDDRAYRHALDRARAQAAAQQAGVEELEADARSISALIRTAEQEARVALSERNRVAGLFERNLAAKKEFDFASQAYHQAQRVLQSYQREAASLGARRKRLEALKRGFDAEAALAQLNIERCSIRAPFDGRIESLLVETGDRVSPGTVVLTLVDPARIEIPIHLPSSVRCDVRVGAPCQVVLESREHMSWEGAVARLAPAADEQTRTFAVFVEVDNAKQASPLLPGMFVRARVRGPIHRNGLLIPRAACRHGRVFVLEEGLARARRVTTERFLEDQALVSGDLRSGERIILSHLDKLTDGSPVRMGASRSTAVGAAKTSPLKSSSASP